VAPDEGMRAVGLAGASRGDPQLFKVT
jgi:hypothetical protein